MKSVLFVSPEFKYRLWGGQRLASLYNQKLPFDKTGEAWCISAHPNGPSKVLNGFHKGKLLNELYQSNPELFGFVESKEFPLLVKIIDANDDLSIQVHPDDERARPFNSLGKTECWYILDASEDSYIILGHNALSRKSFESMVEKGEWNSLLHKVKVKKGDFFYIPAGVLHALGKGILVLETQQSSDITYRLYDYDRVDISGKPRELHLVDGINATTIPTPLIDNQITSISIGDNTITTLINSEFFTVKKFELHSSYTQDNCNFTLITFVTGTGDIEGQSYKAGDSCIVTADFSQFTINPKDPTLIITSHL